MAEAKERSNAALAISVPTAIALVWSYLRGSKAGAAIPDEVVQLLIALAATSEDTKGLVQQILDALSTGSGGQGWPANADSITALRVAINPAAGVEMPSIFIPSGMTLVIKAYALNPAWLWVGASLGEVANVNQAFPLLPNEVVTYQVENANQIYISAMTPAGVATAGCFACLTVEQRRGGA
jgi:hypothetical protein